MKISLEVWHNQKLWSEFDYDSEVNQAETIEGLMDALHALELPGESCTIIAYKLAD